jgi:hypothetical protein
MQRSACAGDYPWLRSDSGTGSDNMLRRPDKQGDHMAKRTLARQAPMPASLQAIDKRAYAHTLSLRLTADQYRRLRRFVTNHEDQTGQRITHQALLETALTEYLDRNGRSNS